MWKKGESMKVSYHRNFHIFTRLWKKHLSVNIFLRNLDKFVKSTNIIQEYMQHKFKRKMGILFWEFEEEGMSIIKGVGLWPSQYLSNLKAFPLALLQPQCERARTLFKLLHISEVSLFWLNQSRPINDKWYWARINYLSITALVAVRRKVWTQTNIKLLLSF